MAAVDAVGDMVRVVVSSAYRPATVRPTRPHPLLLIKSKTTLVRTDEDHMAQSATRHRNCACRPALVTAES